MKYFEVPSFSGEKRIYIVRVYDDGKIKCNCLAYLVGKNKNKECKHIKFIKQAEGYNVENT